MRTDDVLNNDFLYTDNDMNITMVLVYGNLITNLNQPSSFYEI